jgi:hypothetical protein
MGADSWGWIPGRDKIFLFSMASRKKQVLSSASKGVGLEINIKKTGCIPWPMNGMQDKIIKYI